MNQIAHVDILAIGVHPDDIELACSGTLLKHASLGYTFGIIDLTQGELGTRGNAELRLQEASVSAQLMGAAYRVNCNMSDGFFVNDPKHQLQLITLIRSAQPKIVLANTLQDRHPDHGRAGQLIADACFYSGLIKIKTLDPHGEEQAAWRPKRVFHYMQDYAVPSNIVVDISAFWLKKLECIKAFSSQFYHPESKEPITPISTKDFFEFIEGRARHIGRPCGYEFAEAFSTVQPPGIKDLIEDVD